MYSIMSSANSSSFTPFSIWIPFISSLIAVTKTSKTMLNDSGRSEHPSLVPDIKEMLSVFHHVWECLLWDCHIWPLLCCGRFPLCPLIINWYWILMKAFSLSIVVIVWFLFFSLLIWCITLIDLHILKNPCLPGINPTWSWCMILLVCCHIWFASTLLRIFEFIFTCFVWY